MANPVARLGDTSSHGGSIITSAQKSRVEGKLIARVGDTLDCPIHGPNPIQTGSSSFKCEDAVVARSGSVCSCGAVIIGGAIKTFCS